MSDDKTITQKHAPTLYFIVALKLLKGGALLLLALGVFTLVNKDLPGLFAQLLHWLHFDPERSFFAAIATWLDTITPTNVRVVATGTFLCGLFLLVEGVGLAFRARWAIWLTIGESAFFIPIEIFELIRRHNPDLTDHPSAALLGHPKLGLTVVLVLNVAIVWYLLENRERLFRHHHGGAGEKARK